MKACTDAKGPLAGSLRSLALRENSFTREQQSLSPAQRKSTRRDTSRGRLRTVAVELALPFAAPPRPQARSRLLNAGKITAETPTMKIYTRVGDDGGTGLIGGGRVSKDHLRIEAYGTLDELSATIGIVCSQPLNPTISELLRGVQDDLFVMGAQLATPGGGTPSCGSIAMGDVQRIEALIDRYESELPPLRTFILPGGAPAAAALHLSRVVCRRAERRVVSLSGQEAVSDALVPYLNRLSDLFFVLSRAVNREAAIDDVPWRKREITPEIEES